MKNFISAVDELVEKISKNEKDMKEILKIIKGIGISSDEIKKEGIIENSITVPVDEQEINKMTIAAVDGGLIAKNFHGIDLVLLRAVGVVFSYNNGKLESYKYHPSSIVDPVPKIYYEPLYETEFETNSNIERQREEVTRAKEVVEKFKPDIMFMHGSIVPQYTTVPSNDSPLYDNFKSMINSYLELFESCIKNRVILAGIIEDSRGSRFCSIINNLMSAKIKDEKIEKLLKETKDTVILNYLLKFKERTLVFSYSSQPQKNPLLKHLDNHARNLHSFYIKNSELDRPIRVDYLSLGNPRETAEKISSMLVALSKNSMYAIPPMIIEADHRAKLNEDEFDLFYSSLLRKLGNTSILNDLRRMQRPFESKTKRY